MTLYSSCIRRTASGSFLFLFCVLICIPSHSFRTPRQLRLFEHTHAHLYQKTRYNHCLASLLASSTTPPSKLSFMFSLIFSLYIRLRDTRLLVNYT
ncbi:hypothetical protein B0H11DRAFT_1389225 [Mycena galericulata]|nr:hypothetical protein B0H11DRAFT_1389225 [Mycena galericulata]